VHWKTRVFEAYPVCRIARFSSQYATPIRWIDISEQYAGANRIRRMCRDKGIGKMTPINFTAERPSDFPLHFNPSHKK